MEEIPQLQTDELPRNRLPFAVSMDQNQAQHKGNIRSILAVKVRKSSRRARGSKTIKLITLGSVHTSSSDSSSDQEEISMESLSELSESLRLAQTRATTLSTNFARLMRLVVDDELDVLDRQIAQVRNGSHDTLKTKYKEALAECERKRRIAQFRLVAAETEIDIRYQAMAEAEWQQFNVYFHST